MLAPKSGSLFKASAIFFSVSRFSGAESARDAIARLIASFTAFPLWGRSLWELYSLSVTLEIETLLSSGLF